MGECPCGAGRDFSEETEGGFVGGKVGEKMRFRAHSTRNALEIGKVKAQEYNINNCRKVFPHEMSGVMGRTSPF